MSITLPGSLVSSATGPILRRGAPVIWTGERCTLISDPDDGIVGLWLPSERHVEVAPVALVPLDLSDDLGCRIAEAWLARHHGMPDGTPTPRFVRTNPEVPGSGWCVGWDSGCVYFIAAEPYYWPSGLPYVVAPGVANTDEYREALALVCCAAGGAL